MFQSNRRRLPRKLKSLQSRRAKFKEPGSMPLVRQVEVLLFDAYEDTTLTTTHLMSIIVVCIMYLRSRAMPDYLRDRLVTAVDFAERALKEEGLMNPRTLERWSMELALHNPYQDGNEAPDIARLVDEMDIPDDISGMDDPPLG